MDRLLTLNITRMFFLFLFWGVVQVYSLERGVYPDDEECNPSHHNGGACDYWEDA
jgi:hypothetical protein